jgi:hypothetical protein
MKKIMFLILPMLALSGRTSYADGADMKKKSVLHLKTKTSNDLYLACKVREGEVTVKINGSNGGSGSAEGNAWVRIISNLGIYGALPGDNILELSLSSSNQPTEVKCDFIEKVEPSENTEETILHSFQLHSKDFIKRKYAIPFILECHGYYASLEPLVAKAKELVVKMQKDPEVQAMAMKSLRKAMARAQDESAAKKQVEDFLDSMGN